MIIKYEKGRAIAIGFPVTEFGAAVHILKAVYKVSKLAFIREAIEDIESDLAPRLPMVNYFHCCQKCFRMLDEREDNTICITKDGDMKWKHKNCLPINPNRP